MKFNLLYTSFFSLAIYHLILCEDWTHSGGDNDEEDEESKYHKEYKNFQIRGISLPWVKTSRQHLSTISKSFLVQINKYMKDDSGYKKPFFCQVEVMKGLKIIGKLDYDKQQCFIPGKFPFSLTEQMKTITNREIVYKIPNNGEWPIFEVLVNPRQLNLAMANVEFCQTKSCPKKYGLVPARPVLAKLPQLPAFKKRYTLSSYLAICHIGGNIVNFPGVVQQIDENGTLAFYYGLYDFRSRPCDLYVMAVLNTRPPPPPIDYRRRFNKL